MLAIALALAASCCWGTSDFLGGLQTRRLGVITVMVGVQGAPLLVVAGLVLATQPAEPGAQAAIVSVLAGVVGLAGLSALYRALALGPMSLVAPISATGAALPAAVGVAAGDRPSVLQALGLAVAVVGVVIAARPVTQGAARPIDGTAARPATQGAARPAEADGPPGDPQSRLGVVLAILAAVGIGCFLLGAHVGARGGVLWFLLLSRLSGVLPLAAILARQGPSALPRPRQLPPLLAVAALDGSATALLAVANRHGAVSIVSVVGSLYPAVTVLLAHGLLGERLGRSQAVGVAGAMAGVALISAG
ncbi:MAG TPA: DMT family transporter [Solirubrobacteraceae bacterium]|nr:DMT family transporter [Solirubrobacteraceae bacterium]